MQVNPIQNKYPYIIKATFFLLFFILLLYALIEAKSVLWPIIVSALLAYLLFPVANFLEVKVKIPRILAILISLLAAIGLIYGGFNIAVVQIRNLGADFPFLKERTIQRAAEMQSYIELNFGIANEQQDLWIKQRVAKLLEDSSKYFTLVISSATGTIGSMVLLPIFTFFLLFYRDRIQHFILLLVEKRQGKVTQNLLKQISKVTIRYVGGIVIVVLILSFSHSVALSIIGLKYAVILGILSGLLSFIPYFGTIVGGIIPLTFAMITADNPYTAFWIIGYYLVIMFCDHNIITPTIVGGNVHLNPFITIISIIVGGTIWGIPGMIVIVPIIAIIKILCDNVEGLEPYGYILGAGEGKHAISIKNIRNWINKIRKKEVTD